MQEKKNRDNFGKSPQVSYPKRSFHLQPSLKTQGKKGQIAMAKAHRFS